ncbi:MAG TPA: hypothetical protein VFU86_21025 [Terriglobales bacterium]|nr:hypothetical protein [Terriglobales bacterium]
MRRALVVLVVSLMCVAAGCRKSAEMSPNAVGAAGASIHPAWGIDLTNAPGTKFQATFADGVERIDADTVKRTIKGVTRDHSIFFFQNVPEVRDKLAPGKVVLFEGLTFKRIQAIAIDGSQLIVATEKASLTDLFKDANIQWRTPINFRDVHAQKVRARSAANRNGLFNWLDRLEPRVYAADPDSESAEEDEEGWKIKSNANFGTDRVDFNVDLARHGDIEGDISGNGYVKNFESSMALVVNNSNVSKFDFSNANVNGAVDFNWTIGSGSEKPPELGEEKLKLPAIMSVPLFVGGVPFTLEIGEALLFHPAFSTKQEIAKGSFHVDYNGVTGLSVSPGGSQNTSEANANSSIQPSTAFSPYAAFGVVVAIAMPRFELKTGAEEVANEVPDSVADAAVALLEKTTIGHYIHKQVQNVLKTEAAATFQVILSSTASHSGMLSLVPCQRFTLHLEGQVSADAQVLGIKVPNMPKVPFEQPYKIFEKDIDLPNPPGKICTG